MCVSECIDVSSFFVSASQSLSELVCSKSVTLKRTAMVVYRHSSNCILWVFRRAGVVRVPWMSDSVGIEGTLVPSQLRYICCACVCVLEPRSKPRKYAPYTCTADVGSSKAFLSLLSKPPGDNRIYRLSCFVKPRML